MKTDIVFPSGNEEKLAKSGKELGFERLIFVYSAVSDVKKISSSVEIKYGVLVKEKNKNKLNKLIDQIRSKGFLVLVEASEDDYNRFVLERTKAEMIFGLEMSGKRDKMHYRRSGLDQVLCKITKEKGKIIAFNFKKILDKVVLGRMIQNLRFCRKYKVKTLLGSFASKPEEMKSSSDLSSFLHLLEQKFL